MKLTIHVITDKHIIAIPNEVISTETQYSLLKILSDWNEQDRPMALLLPCDSVVIDMRASQKEQIEKLIQEALEARAGQA